MSDISQSVSTGPASLISGATLQEEPLLKVAAQIDTVRLTGVVSEQMFSLLMKLLPKRFGQLHPHTGESGRYRERYTFERGVTVERGHKIGGFDGAENHVVVCLSGVACGHLVASGGLQNQVAAISEIITHGVTKCTRLDIAVDHRAAEGRPITLIRDATDALSLGRYVGKERAFRIVQSRSASKGVDGDTLYVGKRGNLGSGILLRIYDKGLESKSAPAGEWVRWEVEFNAEGERSQQALARILDVDFSPYSSTGWARGERGLEDLLIAMAYGVIDFRDDNDSGMFWRDRPRLDWWADLVAGVDVIRLRCIRRVSDLSSKLVYLRQAASVVRAFADAAKRDVQHVVAQLGLFEVDPSQSVGTWRAALEFASYDEAQYFGPLVT